VENNAMNQDPTSDEVLAFAAGELLDDRMAAVAAWVDANPRAAQFVRDFHRVAELTRSDDSTAVPRGVTRKAMAIPRALARAATIASWLEDLKAAVAHLTFDSRLQPLAIRSGADTRHLTFESEMISADLSLTCHVGDGEHSIALSGQIEVSGDALAACRVSLRDPESGNEIKSLPVGETGYFSSTLAEGPMEVLVDMGGVWIHLPGVSS
jgi:hypothetical protein